MAKGVLTDIGKEKICRAHTGDSTLPIITKIAFGDGGVDSNGNVIDTTGSETTLKSQLIIIPIDGHSYPNKTSCRFTKRLVKADLIGKSISELGLFDADNDLIMYKTFPAKAKGDDEEFVFDMDEIL
ncbi:phage tail protein [Enterocloster bolteae]|uniref:phage tail-collar fiber domain-containing protein n=1 Tax=Enterocloster bolteae TaxID=208479 RepID=UPI002A80CC2C|nr:phage tail protein [Enterocloster bolteae]